MDGSRLRSRRRVVVGCGTLAALGTLAGCVGGGDEDDGTEAPDGEDDGTEAPDGEDGDGGADGGNDGGDGSDDGDSAGGDDSGDDEDSAGGDDSGDGGPDTERDLREANVVGVSFERQDGEYRFEVALHHDDNGEDGYANWWQVERLDGTQLGRRELLHAHAQQPFTRSETVEIPEEVGCVVLRGHDQTHGYGGQAATVSLDSEETRLVGQGVESEPFDAGDCPG